ncbi:hypothetical protein HYW21_04580 [Candidatus Woesearchaeota archaeon]|nr:hypothetical protein [Candidatus Woesearchaeota archaeon]
MNIERIIASGKYDLHTIEDVVFRTDRTDYMEVEFIARHNDGIYRKKLLMVLSVPDNFPEHIIDFLTSRSLTKRKPTTMEEVRQGLTGLGYFTFNYDRAKSPPRVRGIKYDPNQRLFTVSPAFPEKGFYQGNNGVVDDGDTSLLDYLPTKPFTSFAEEKEFRRQYGRNKVWAWGSEGYLNAIESNVREVVATLNRLPFAYVSDWSHSGTPKDHGAFVQRGCKQRLKRRYTLDSLAGGDSTFVGDHAGYIIFRADESNEAYNRFHAQVTALPSVEIVDLVDSNDRNRRNKVLVVRANRSYTETGKVRAYQRDLEQKWAQVLTVMRDYVPESR